jgi:hypothetical protein
MKATWSTDSAPSVGAAPLMQPLIVSYTAHSAKGRNQFRVTARASQPTASDPESEFALMQSR